MLRSLALLALLLALAAAPAAGALQDATPAAGGSGAWAALRRPLDLPSLEAGAPCPRQAGRQVSPYFGLASGDGPLYPTLGADGVLGVGGREEGGWFYQKVLWFAGPDYAGRALVRGGRLDGAGEVRFGTGPDPAAELRLGRKGGTVAGAPGWRHWPSYTRLRAPGCYAYQVDGEDFTAVIVFEAVAGPAASPVPAAATPVPAAGGS